MIKIKDIGFARWPYLKRRQALLVALRHRRQSFFIYRKIQEL